MLVKNTEPFYYPGNDTGILLIHGFTGAPTEMHPLGEYLAGFGYTVLGIRLAGHGTKIEDMNRMHWSDWSASVLDGWHLLQSTTKKIFLVGLSMGGSLALYHSSFLPVAGVVGLSAPYKIRSDPRRFFLPYMSWLIPYVEKGDSDWQDHTAKEDHFSYDLYPTKAIIQLCNLLEELRSSLDKVRAPALLIHSKKDLGVPLENLDLIYNALGTSENLKKKVILENSGHVITRDQDKDTVFQTIQAFIAGISNSEIMKRDFILVTVSLIIWGVGEGAFVYFQPLYLQDLGASPLVIGTILGGVGLAMTLFHIPAGFLSDRIGRRRLMWAAWGMGVITTGIMAAARSLAVFSIGIILYSITVFVIAPLNSYITAARGKLSVEQVLTTNNAAFYLGGIAGPLIGGSLAQATGIRSIYFFAFGCFIISSIIILFIKPQPIEVKLKNPAGDLLKNKRFISYLPVLLLVYFALFFPQPLAPNYLRNELSISLQTIGTLGAITNMGIVIINLLFGYLPPQVGLILGQLFVGIFAALVWQFTQMPMLVLAYFLLGGFRATRSLLIAQVEKLVQPANLGLAYGVVETITGIALMAAPPIAGVLYTNNPDSVFGFTLILIIPAILFTLLWRKLLWKL